MKRLKYILILLLVVYTTRLHGDIIIIEPTSAKICSRITNLNNFPDLVVIGLTDCVTLESKKAFRIKNNDCIKVQKSCSVLLYIMKLDYYKQHKLDEIDWNTDKNVQKLNLSIKEKDFNSYDFSSVTIDFSLANYRNTVYYLYKTKMTYKYKYNADQTKSDSIKYFKDDNVDPYKPISVKTEHAPR